MMIAGLDHVAIMQADGWETIDEVACYVESAAAHNLHERRWAIIARAWVNSRQKPKSKERQCDRRLSSARHNFFALR
jgi:hypothetical protein